MKVVPFLGGYIATERTPGIGGGVMSPLSRTPVEAITRCMIRKAAAYQNKVVLFDTPVRDLRAVCQCCPDSPASLTQLPLFAA